MKLLYSPASPYVCKVRLAARLAGIDWEEKTVDAMARDAKLLASNPLGKIPCLVLDDGQAVFDSRVITRYLDRASGGKLYPADADQLLGVERLEALADGICDSAVAGMYEIRLRPEEKWHQPWIDRQWGKVARGLDALETSADLAGGPLNAGHCAVAATLGYLDLRYNGRWEPGHLNLVAWLEKFAGQTPAWPELKPAA